MMFAALGAAADCSGTWVRWLSAKPFVLSFTAGGRLMDRAGKPEASSRRDRRTREGNGGKRKPIGVVYMPE